MSSNRRRDGGAGLARACKAALMCCLLATAGIGYVHQSMDQDRLGRLLAEQEVRMVDLREEHRRQTAIRSMLSSPEAIQERVRHHHLNLSIVTPQQRLFVTVPSTFSPVPPMVGSTLGGQPPVRPTSAPTFPSRMTTLAQIPR